MKCRTRFEIELDCRDINLLENIKAFFGVGTIIVSKRLTATYVVCSIKDLISVIIPHFMKYPMLTAQKQADYGHRGSQSN